MSVIVESEILLVTLVGFEQRDCNVIDLVFQRDDVESCILTNAEQAHLAIVDLDKYGAAAEWAALQQAKPDQVAVLMSINEVLKQSGHFFVKKPAKVVDIVAQLKEARKKLLSKGDQVGDPSELDTRPVWKKIFSPRLITDNKLEFELQEKHEQRSNVQQEKNSVEPDVQKEISEKVFKTIPEEILFSEKGYLIEVVKQAVHQAITEGQGIRLQIGSQGSIFIDPAEHWVNTDFIPVILQELCCWPLNDVEIYKHICGEGEFGKYMEGWFDSQEKPIDIDQFLWDLSLWTYQGRLPDDIDLEKKTQLTSWPDLPRFTPIPNAIRIASLWVSIPVTVCDTAEVLKIPEKDVFNFYSAAYSLGLIRQVEEEAPLNTDKLPDKRVGKSQRQFFLRVLNHLSGRNLDDR